MPIVDTMLFFSTLSLSLITLFSSLCNAQMAMGVIPNHTFQVGVILDFDSLVGRVGLCSLSLALSDFYSSNTNYTTTLVLHVRDSKGQVIDAAATALSLLKNEKVDAIIGPQKSGQASFVIGLGDRAKVPIISFSATSPSLHPQTPYFIQSALSDASQVGAIASVVEHFHWTQVVLIYEESDYGNGIISYLANAFQDVNARILYRSVIPLSATDDYMLQELYKMKSMQTRVFVVHLSTSLASRLFPKVKEAGMLSEGYSWIVTSGVMDLFYSLDPHVVETMHGVLGVKPLIPRSRQLSSTAKRWKRKFLNDNPDVLHAELSLFSLWAYDTLWALAMAAERVRFREPSSLQNTTSLNSTNPFNTETSQTGPKLVTAMSEVTFQGLGGKFHLVDGQLEPPSFQILNVVGNGEREVGIWTQSQGILSESNVNLTSSSNRKLKSIIFPGDSTIVPKGWEVPISGKKLRVGVPVEAGFTEFVKVEKDPLTNSSKISGCYIDMFDAVMKALPYSVPYEYVPFERPDGSSAGSYDDFSYQVFLQNYDVAVGDITITSKRSNYVDYALPFAAGGVTITVPITYDDPNSNTIFLKPLTKEMWLTAIALFILTGTALWILEHRFNKAYRGTPSEHTGMIFYFPFMSLVFAQRERIVTNLARLVVVVWMFVVLILSSTYTASLSARLTVQRLQPAVTDVSELIRGGGYVGCHRGSFIYDLLQDLGFDKSRIRTYKYPEDCDEALSKGSAKGGISALFSVTPYTKRFLSNYCDKYTTVGPTYPTEGFAFVFQKGSPLVADVSRAVIDLTEKGRMSEIEEQWIKHMACNGQDARITSTSISLKSFKTLFAVTAGITATCLVVFLGKYIYKNRDFVRRIANSNTTIWSKFRAICSHFDQRDPALSGEDTAGPNYPRDPGTCTVVPISSVELNNVICSHFDQRDTALSSGEGDMARPNLPRDTGTCTVVPVSSVELNNANGAISPDSEHRDRVRSDGNVSSSVEVVY